MPSSFVRPGGPRVLLSVALSLSALSTACSGSVDKDSAALEGGAGNTAGDPTGGSGATNGGTNEGDGESTSGASDGGNLPALGCDTPWAQRLTVTNVTVDSDIGYLVPSYDGFPQLDRIDLSVAPDGSAQVAWMTADHTAVHVTPLDAKLTRAGADTVVPGLDLGGLVAHDDGFAVLTRREDPGAEVAFDESEKPNKAALVVRYRDGQESFSTWLTGTMGIDGAHDFSNGLNGALRWNGKTYGAYFVIRGGTDHWASGHYGDKLVYFDGDGKGKDGGWGWNCSHNEGIRLLAEPERFTPLCFSDAYPNAGLNLVIENNTQYLAPEQNWAGYTAGNFGSILHLSDGRYLIAWSSKGDGGVKTMGDVPELLPAKQTSDIAFTHLDKDRVPSGKVSWLTDTQKGVAELDVRLAAYGDGVVALWQRIEDVPNDKAMPFGKSAGLHVQQLTLDGEPVGEAVTLKAGAPTWNADVVELSNGDLAWAYVLEKRATDAPYSEPPASRTLKIARLAHCE